MQVEQHDEAWKVLLKKNTPTYSYTCKCQPHPPPPSVPTPDSGTSPTLNFVTVVIHVQHVPSLYKDSEAPLTFHLIKT